MKNSLLKSESLNLFIYLFFIIIIIIVITIITIAALILFPKYRLEPFPSI